MPADLGARGSGQGSGTGAGPRFSPGQLRQVAAATHRAEDLLAGFYCIRGREWPRIPYHVATLRDGPGPAERVFADIVQVLSEPGAPRRERSLYRIRLRDDVVLDALRRPEGVTLPALLLYVLTHELVHVLRFSIGMASFEAPPRERDREELRVHAITRRLLRPRTGRRTRSGLAAGRRGPDPAGLDRVLELYREAVPDLPPLPSRK